MSRELLAMALDALDDPSTFRKTFNARAALRAALAAPEPEPVAQKPRMTVLEAVLRANPLAMPPAAPAVPLTDEQIWSMWMSSEFRGNGGQVDWFCEGIRAAEAHHGITGGKP